MYVINASDSPVTLSRRTIRGWCRSLMGEMRNSCRISVGKPEGENILEA
jgi:hypothetical protein